MAQHTGSVTTRALRILEAFTPDHPDLTISELARRTGIPTSTAHRLASDLLAWGALDRAEGRYHIGLKLWEIASLAPRGLVLREAALPVMEDLAHVTAENIQLGVRDGTEVVFIERIRSQRSVPLRTRVGGRFALAPTGVGLALLAFAPHAVQRQVCTAPLERFTEHTVTDGLELRRTLAEIRGTGVAISDRQISLDTVSVAAPIFDRRGNPLAAISVVADARVVKPAPLAPLIRTAALTIARTLSPPHVLAAGLACQDNTQENTPSKNG